MQYKKDQNKRLLQEQGYVVCKNFFKEKEINELLESAKKIFKIQFDKFGYIVDPDIDYEPDELFKQNMIKLFTEHEEVFINCGKIIQQGLIELYQLPLKAKLLNEIRSLGLHLPNMCTRPVLYFNHPDLAKQEVYYKTPKHQDWPSIETSIDSIVIWVPLIDVNKENGSIILYPGSHKQGVLPFKTNGGFAEVEYEGESIQKNLKVGDIVIFSTLLVHESGRITNNEIRWSASFRFCNMISDEFISRGYPCLYKYVPITK